MPAISDRVASLPTTIFTEINDLAQQHNAVNLGQGRPDFDTPDVIVDAAVRALQSGSANQYAPGFGVPVLRQQVAQHAACFYGLEVDADQGVIVTSGASEGLFSSIMAVVDPGDEVILIEPFFDIYKPAVEWAGGVPVYVPMRPPEWHIDLDALQDAFSDRTRLIIINTPHNPTGRVLNDEELGMIARLAQQHDTIVISDEVYEHLVYDDASHVPIASLPGMFERTLTVSSAAKTFSVTGWKVGWVFGPPALIQGVWRIHQNVVFAVNHPAQLGVAYALSLGDDYYAELRRFYDGKRHQLADALQQAGFSVASPQGAFYIMANFSALHDGDDVVFSRYLIESVGVATIPPSAFFSQPHRDLTQHYVRFAYCKTDEVLGAAIARLQTMTAPA